MPLTILCDSYTKSSEIMDIINENDSIDVYFEKISDYMDKNKLGNQERDENGLHIICDDPSLNFWEQNKLKNELTRRCLEDGNENKSKFIIIDDEREKKED